MSARTCSTSMPSVSRTPCDSAQNMKASSESGLWAMCTFTISIGSRELDEARREDAIGVEALLRFDHHRPLVAEVRRPALGAVEGDVARQVALAAVGDRQLARHLELSQRLVEELLRHRGQDPPAHDELPLRVHEERRVGGAGVS